MIYSKATEAKADLILKLNSKLSELNFEQQIETKTSLESLRKGEDPPKTSRDLRFVKRLNDEVEVVFYPGISVKRGKLRVDALIGVESTTLRKLAAQSNNLIVAQSNGRVCHKYLGLYGPGLGDVFGLDESMEELADLMLTLVRDGALPELSKYDNLAKVRSLLRSYLMGEWNGGVAILEPTLKLHLLEDCRVE